MHRPLRSLVALAVVAAVVTAGCASSPTGRKQLKLFPAETMDAMGVQAFDQLKQEQPISRDAAADAYVRCVTAPLLAELEPRWRSGWEVVVFADQTANAFALPGRKIGVHLGLLRIARTQDQLAAVIGHEIGHVLADHSNERVSQQSLAQIGLQTVAMMTDPSTVAGQTTLAALGIGAEYGVLLPFSRAHESEADAIGLDLMARAGFEPSEAVQLWDNMAAAGGGQQPPEWASTHPSHSSRKANLTAGLPAANASRDAARRAGKNPRCTPPALAR